MNSWYNYNTYTYVCICIYIYIYMYAYTHMYTNIVKYVYLQEEAISGGHDGKWKDTQYFKSQQGRGLFFPLSKLKPDRRFGSTFKIEQQQNR